MVEYLSICRYRVPIRYFYFPSAWCTISNTLKLLKSIQYIQGCAESFSVAGAQTTTTLIIFTGIWQMYIDKTLVNVNRLCLWSQLGIWD